MKKPKTLEALERRSDRGQVCQMVAHACGFSDFRLWRRRGLVGRHPFHPDHFSNVPSCPGHMYDDAVQAARLYAETQRLEVHIEYAGERANGGRWRVVFLGTSEGSAAILGNAVAIAILKADGVLA